MSVFVVGADRGFAAFGYAVFELTPVRETVVEVGVIETKKGAKKQNYLAASDNDRRTKELYEALSKVFINYEFLAAASEASSLPRNSSTAYKIGRADGVWSCMLAHFSVPLAEESPQGIKKKLCGKATAPKTTVQAALEKWYPGQFDRFKELYPRGKWEHGFDAAAAVIACLDSDVMKMARRMMK